MEEKKSKVGWVLGGIGAVLFAAFIFYLSNPRWFGERFIHFDGEIKRLQPLGGDRLLVIEDVQAGGGEDGPTTVGDRWRILEVPTGKLVAGPHFVDPTSWTTVQSDRLLLMHQRDLEVRDLDNQLLATLASFRGVSNLRSEPNHVRLGADGGITAMAEDGRIYALEVKTLQATLVPAAGPSHSVRALERVWLSGLELKGQPRAQVNGKGPDYLEPRWLEGPQTGKGIPAAGGWLMLHYLRMSGTEGGRGPLLSAVNAEGEELWRYAVPFAHLKTVLVVGELLVVGVDEHEEYGPGWIRVLSLATGQEAWRMSL